MCGSFHILSLLVKRRCTRFVPRHTARYLFSQLCIGRKKRAALEIRSQHGYLDSRTYSCRRLPTSSQGCKCGHSTKLNLSHVLVLFSHHMCSCIRHTYCRVRFGQTGRRSLTSLGSQKKRFRPRWTSTTGTESRISFPTSDILLMSSCIFWLIHRHSTSTQPSWS